MSFKQELTAAYHEMLDIKVSLGYKQRNYMSHILPFIEFCADSYPDAKDTPYTFPIITEQCNGYSLSGNTSRFSHRLNQKGFFFLIPA